MKNPVLSASIAFLTRLNFRGISAFYEQIGDLTLIMSGAAPKVDKNRCECLIFVYRLVEIRSRGLESRQKPVEMCEFCLPAGRNSGRAASKVGKNRGECLIFVYRLVQNRSAQPRK